MELLRVLSALDADALEGLARSFSVTIDPIKRLGLADQVARGMVLAPRKLRLERLPEDLAEAVRLLLAAPRGLPLASLPRGVLAHVDAGLVFRDPQHPTRMLIPAAFRLQFPASPSDSPRAARLLLQSVPEDPRRELCQHHLKRLPALPWAMLLEPVLMRLEDAVWIKQELAALSELEGRFLNAVDALGGEVNSEEVLELSREPMRMSHGGAVQVPRRSPVFALARRGLLLARHEGWVIPDEVERVIGRERRARAGNERQRLFMARHEYDLTPARGQLAEPAGAAAVALIAGLAAADHLPSRGRGISRTALRRVAHELHIDAERAELLGCLARADGLFFASTTVRSVSERIIAVYLRGGAWDEAAREPDMYRPGHPATARATALVRDALFDALLLVPAHEFARTADIEAVACADRRALSAQRALSVAGRAGQVVHDQVLDVVRALLTRTFRWLGLVDEGVVDEGAVLRLSAFARRVIEAVAREASSAVEAPAHDIEVRGPLAFSFGARADVAALVESARASAIWFDGERIGLSFSGERLNQAAERDPQLLGLRAALSALFPSVPDALEAALSEAAAQLPVAGFTAAAGFVAVDDAVLRKALYDDPRCHGLWAGPPLRDGLLVAEGVGTAALIEALGRFGVRFHPPAQP